MPDNLNESNSDYQKMENKVNYLEKRISRIEALLGVQKPLEYEMAAESSDLLSEEDILEKKLDSNQETVIESRIGEFGLAWLGSIVLLFGIAFLTQFIQNTGRPILSAVFGYCAVIGVFFVAHMIRKSFASLSSKFNFLSHILVYYVTLRLHFYTAYPVFSSEVIPLILMLIIIAVQFFLSNKHKSEFLATIAILLLLITSVISSSDQFMFVLVTATAGITLLFLFRFGWWKLFLFSQFMVYLSFAIWYFENQTLKPLTSDHYTIIYLFICVSIFSIITFIKQNNVIPNSVVFISIFLNGFFFTLILSIYIVSFYSTNYVGIFIPVSIICLLFSIVLKRYSEWKFAPAFYALYSFVALSTAVYGIYGLPVAYFLLSIQSLLVVSMAIWFSSRIIVIMNFFLYLMLLITYFTTSPSINSINISFAVIALVSARIINWKKDRLEIQTDLLRNVYMIVAFLTVLYSLYKAVPENYVTLSWTIAAVIYFVVSIILHNIKYRWMAISTMIAAAIYLFIVDLATVGMVYRIIAFMFLSIISIGISLYYAKQKKKNSEPDKS